MVVPIVYRKASSQPITFQWADALNNTGYNRYFVCAASEDGGTAYFLTVRQVDSRPVWTDSAANGDSTEINCDIMFQRPVTIRGAAYVNSTLRGNSAPNNYITKFIVYHVSTAPAETSIGSENTNTHATAGVNRYYRDCVEIDITETSFAPGEILRLAITTNANAAVGRRLYHDPNASLTFTDSEDARTIGSDITFDVPFKLT